MKSVVRVTLLLFFYLSITSALNKDIIVSIDDADKTQYHEANFNTSSYNYGYELGPNRQFHHEISSDGVTVGCFGYVNTEEKLLVTHYVADDHGYRVVQSNKPTRIYPKSSGLKILTPDESENFVIKQGKFTDWKDLKMPNECRSSDLEVISDNFKQQAGLKGLPNLPEPGVDVNSIKNLPSNDKTTNTESASNSLPSSPDNVDFRNPKYNQEGSDTSVDGRYGNGEGQGSLPIDLQRSDPQFGGSNIPLLSSQLPLSQKSSYSSSHQQQSSSSSSHPNSESSSSFQTGSSHGNPQNQGESAHGSHAAAQHVGTFSISGPLGQIIAGHHGSATWDHNKGTDQNGKPSNSGYSYPKPESGQESSGGNFQHGGSFIINKPHGQLSGGHQTSGSYGGQNQGQGNQNQGQDNQGQGNQNQGQDNQNQGQGNQNQGQGNQNQGSSHGIEGSHQHGGSFTHTGHHGTTSGEINSQHQGSSSSGNPNQGSNHNYGGNHQHGGTFTHSGHHGQTSGQISSQHQGSSSSGNPNQGSNHNYGGSHQHGGSFTHTGHHGTTSGQINSQHQGSSHENGGSYQHGGSFVHTGHHGQVSGSHQSGGSWGQQGQYKPDNSGQYVPDNSGSYVHQPGENGPDSPPYEHVQGPSGGSGGQGNGGGYGPSGGYGPDGGQGPNGPDGPDGPNGPNGPSGGYGPSGGNGGNGDNSENSHQNNNCTNPDHQHSTTSRPTFTRPTTRKTTVFSPRPSFSRPTTQTEYPQTSPSNYPSYVPPSSTEYTTERPKQTYPTRPMSTPNPTGSGSGNLGVQPPSTRPTTPNPNLYVPGNQPPFFIIPFPFPFAPTCPCYFAEPKGNYSSQNQQQMQWQQHMEQNNQWQSQVQYAIGFIPVLFVPHCSPSNHSNQLSGQYLQVPYPCAQCNQSQRNSRGLDSTENYSSSDSFRQVLAQAGVDIFSNSLVKSPNRNSRARKLKRFRNVEESNFNELTDNKQNSSKDEK